MAKKPALAPSAPTPLETLISALEGRARRLRKESYVFLALIVSALIAGAAAFIFAAWITALDFGQLEISEQITRADNELDALAQETLSLTAENKAVQANLNAAVTEVLNASDEYAALVAKLGLKRSDLESLLTNKLEDFKTTHIRTINAKPFTGSVLQSKNLRPGEFYIELESRTAFFEERQVANEFMRSLDRDKIDAINEELQLHEREMKDVREAALSSVPDLERRVAEITGRLTEIRSEEAVLRDLRDKLVKDNLTFRVTNNNVDGQTPQEVTGWLPMIQTNVTRFGGLLLIIFLVRVILPQYRYNIRLSAFYAGRADALRMENSSSRKISDLAEILTPDIGFDVAPKVVNKEMTEFVKALNGLNFPPRSTET